MKKYLFPSFAAFYIVCILVNSICGTYGISCDYYKIKKNNACVEMLEMFLQLKYVQIYTHFTGANTGYGFFAPNVKSNGILITESCGKSITPHFNSFETKLRYHNLSSRVVNDIFNNRDSSEIDKKYVQLETDYYNLIFKNIALKLINDSDCTADSVAISYHLIAMPTLAEKRENKDASMELFKYKELTFSLNK